MQGLVIAGVSLAMFVAVYLNGVMQARLHLRRTGQWVEPPRPLPQARIRRRARW
jgi:hypothetical protein